MYRYNDFLDALRVMYSQGIANKYFYMGDDSADGHIYGLVNIAGECWFCSCAFVKDQGLLLMCHMIAFLAQSMKETIKVSYFSGGCQC